MRNDVSMLNPATLWRAPAWHADLRDANTTIDKHAKMEHTSGHQHNKSPESFGARTTIGRGKPTARPAGCHVITPATRAFPLHDRRTSGHARGGASCGPRHGSHTNREHVC